VDKQLKDVPSGKKGKGLSMLPTSVRNNMGFKKRGGVIKASAGKFVCPRKEMAGALKMPTRKTSRRSKA
tara:strand:+ start:595 stop:801 length:207 start_codon:yes stop_codon:yes gene_type:complete